MTSAPAATSEMDPLDQLGAKAFNDDLVRANERMLPDGFQSEVTLEYDPVIAQERSRAAFPTDEWRDFLIRSIGLEPTALDERAKMVVLLRMAPFVERNFNKPRSCTASPGCRRAGGRAKRSVGPFCCGSDHCCRRRGLRLALHGGAAGGSP